MTQSAAHPIVQKYGGSSLSTLDKVRAVANKVIHSAERGRPVVVVVSAMGNTTSDLIDRARKLSPSPPRRELDVLLSSGERMSMALLAMAIEEAGHRAISLTGPQSGIVTDDKHTDATILAVRPDRVSRELSAGRIVIVAGYQGQGPSGEVTTLGRGGSDTTAVALAGALGAERCEIYSDVAGVYTADPRIVEEPMHLERVDAGLMTEYALHGARVLHPPCIELAERHDVALHALATFGDGKGTRIAGDAGVEYSPPFADAPAVVGVTSRKRRLRVRMPSASSKALEQALGSLGDQDGLLRAPSDSVDDCLVDIEDLPDSEEFGERVRERLNGVATVSDDLASVSVVAADPKTLELRSRVESILLEAGASVLSTYHRLQSVTCAIDPADRRKAVRALHESLIEEPMAVGA